MSRHFTVAAFLALAPLAGCDGEKPPRSARRPRPHVISLSPALTGMFFEMGLGEHVVGVTQYCVLPPGQSRPVVGDLMRANVEAMLAVEPDVAIVEGKGGGGRNSALDAVARSRPGFRVETVSTTTLDDVRAAIRKIGQIVSRPDVAEATLARFDARLAEVRKRVAGMDRPKVVFIVGFDRPFVIGSDNFTHEMIEIAGGRNGGLEIPGRKAWRQTNTEGILAVAPDVVICQVDPPEANRAKAFWLTREALPAARSRRVHVVTDPHWTIPSTRLAEMTARLSEVIHPASARPTPSGAKP